MAVCNPSAKRKLWCEETMLKAVKSVEEQGKGLHEPARIIKYGST